MGNISNKQVICETLIELARGDADITVLCSDSRGSASLAEFFDAYPKQSVETGIAEQNLVSIAAGLASCGKKPYAASPASFLATRSLEQIKVDVAYSRQNVKLIGISGGISYGALGMTHHSNNDIACVGSIPGMRVYIPSDRYETGRLIEAVAKDALPAYIRVGRNAVGDVYDEDMPFELDKAIRLKEGNDACIIACGEMVLPAYEAAKALEARGISCGVIDMYCVKPLDVDAVREACATGAVLTVEEHNVLYGMGSTVAQIAAEAGNVKVKCLGLPDAPVVTGKSAEVFRHYGLDAPGIASVVEGLL